MEQDASFSNIPPFRADGYLPEGIYVCSEAEHIVDGFHLTMRLTVLDQYGKGLVHGDQGLGEEMRQQIGRKGVSNHRWIVGGKLCLLLNQWGLIFQI